MLLITFLERFLFHKRFVLFPIGLMQRTVSPKESGFVLYVVDYELVSITSRT